MVIDSTVLIDVLRGKEQARDYLENLRREIKTSRVVVMEIIAGSKNKLEMKKNLRFVDSLHMDILEIDKQISVLAGKLFEKYYLQFGLAITDALIAATAMERSEKLMTHNLKHFRFIDGLDLIVPY